MAFSADYTLPLDQLPDPLPIVPLARPFDVTITPPGSKSITNRAYVLAALARGESRIIRPLRSDDTDGLLNALCTLGAQAKWVPGETGDGSEDVLITGVGGRFPRGGTVNLGDGGTPTRFMIACACLAAAPVVVDGSKRMRERPIAEGVEMLRQLGADIEYIEQEGRLPVRVTPSENFRGGELTVGRTASSQFVSAVMLIGPHLSNGLRVEFDHEPTSPLYVAVTHLILQRWHAELDSEYPEPYCSDPMAMKDMPVAVCPRRIRFRHTTIGPKRFAVPPDSSSLVYWCLAIAIAHGSRLCVPWHRPNLPQPDDAAIVYLGAQGSPLRDARGSEFTASALPSHGRIDASHCPDGSLAIAARLALAVDVHTITGLHTLRVKETDRIVALANELRKVGCTVETTEDSITIHPIPNVEKRAATVRERPEGAGSVYQEPLPHGRGFKERVHGSESRATTDPPLSERGSTPIIIETYNDHRMAMAFAVLGLRVPGIQIRNPACVRKSYPGFWRDFARLYG